MAKASTDEPAALGPNGEPVVTEETKKTIRRKATPQEVGANGNGTAAASLDDGPVNPLIGHAGGKKNADPDRIVAVKLYKGTSAKSGTHVTTIDGDEIEKVDEDYIRGNFSAEWGFGPWYVQGINRKGQPVAEGGQMVNIGAPKNGTTAPLPSGEDAISKLLMLQIQQANARAEKSEELVKTLLVNIASKKDDGSLTPVLTAIVGLIGAMGGKKDTDPALLQMLTDSQARARESESSMRELLTKLATNPPASADSKLLDSASKVMDLAVQAAGIGQSGTDPTVEKFKIVKDGIKDAVSEIAPIVAGAFKRTPPAAAPAPSPTPAGAPEKPKRRLLVTQFGAKPQPTAPQPAATAPAPAPSNGNGTAHAEAPQPAPAPQPQPEVDPEVDALRQVDQALRNENIPPSEIGKFIFDAGESGVIPGWQVGGLGELTPEGLKPWPKRLALMKGIPEIAEWANEPMWSRLIETVAALKALIQAKAAKQAETANA